MISTDSRITRQLLGCLLGLGLCLTAATSLGGESARFAERVAVQLNWKHQFEFAAFYAAQEQGYYRQAGLDVAIREGGPGIDAVREVSEGRADFGVGTSALVVQRYRGLPVVALATLMQHSPTALLALRRNGVQSVHDLAGKPIAVDPHSRDEIEAYLRASGMPAGGIRLADQTDWTLDSLHRGLVAAKVVYVSNEPFLIQGREHDYLLLTPRSAGIDLFGNMLFGMERTVKARPRTVAAFREATLKGLVYALEHPEAVSDLILGRYNTQGKSREHLLFEAAQIRELTRPDIVEPGYMSPGRWRHAAEVYASQGKMTGGFDLTEFIYDATPRKTPAWVIWTLIGALVGLLLALLFVVKFRRLTIHLKREIAERAQAETALHESEAKYRELVDNANAIILRMGLDGKVTYFNEFAERFFGYSAEEIVGRHVLGTIVPPLESDTGRDLSKLIEAIIADPASYADNENENITRDGRRVYIHWTNRVILDQDSHPTGVLSIGQDITRRRQAEIAAAQTKERLTESELRLKTIIDAEPECVKLLAADGTLLQMNQAGLDMIEAQSEAQVVGYPVAGIVLPPYREAFRALTDQVFAGQSRTLEFQIRGLRGTLRWLETHAAPLRDATGNITALLGVTRDITERKAAEQAITNLAFYDPLTQLPNRRLLMDRLQQAMAISNRNQHYGALLFIDLDNFKLLNDSRGHDIGDKLLIQVAQRLQICMREGDSVARLGGDEFVVMLEDLDKSPIEAANQAEAVALKIHDLLNQPYQLDELEHHSTPSIGVTLFRDKTDTVDVILKRADLAMYQAKACGRNTIRFFDPAMQASVEARSSMEADLRRAIQRNDFILHYQPQVDPAGRRVGVEALVRWRHPERGLVSPLEFISLAEETGLIIAIGQQVLRQACDQLRIWSRQPAMAHLSMSVNISPRQFHHADFVDMVLASVDATDVEPCRLVLEITENLLLENLETTITRMHALKSKGIRFSIDDFGTGYSSLAYLKRLPLDELKIDRSFVADIETDDNAAAICAAFISLAHILGLHVVAEGVETEAQRHFLSTVHGCDTLQGFLFGRPAPADRIVVEDQPVG